MDSLDLCDAATLQPFVSCLNLRGIPVARYLERQYIPPEMVMDSDAKIIKRQAWRFFEDVERCEGLVSLGFLDGDKTSIGSLGSLGQSLLKAVTLKDAIDTFSRLLSLFAEGNTCRLQQGGDLSWLFCYTQGLDRTARVSDHYTIVILREVIRLAAGPEWEPPKMWLYSHPLKSTYAISQIANAEVKFGNNAAGIAFPTKLLSQPVQILTESFTHAKMEDALPVESRNTSDTLQTILASFIKHRMLPTAAEAAEILGTNRTTLYRKLETDGTSYRQQCERARFEKASMLLVDPAMSIKEISYELGYSHQANFGRAFRRLSGLTPTQYRNRNL